MRIGTFAQHMGQNIVHNVKSIDRLGIQFAGLTEQDMGSTTTLPLIRGAIGDRYDVLTKDKGGHSQEVPILFRRRRAGLRWRVLTVEVERVSRVVGEGGIGNDRWMTTIRVDERRFPRRRPRRRFAMIQTHWNAAIQDRNTGLHLDNARWQAMDEIAGAALEAKIKALRAEGRQVTVGGDFNYRQKGKSADWYYAPERIFARRHLHFVDNGLDYLAWSGGLHPKDGVHVIPPNPANPKALNRSDHPWLYADFVWER